MDKKRLETIADLENKRRNKGIIVLIIGILATLGLSFIYTTYSFFSVQKQIAIKSQPREAIDKKEIEKDWKTYMEYKLKRQQKKIHELENRINELNTGQKNISEKLDMLINQVRETKESLSQINSMKISPPISPPIKNEKDSSIIKPPIPVRRERQTRKEIPNKFLEEELYNKEKEEKKEIIKFEPKSKKISKKIDNKKELKLPVGFVKGVLLSGSDFPTMQYGRNNPHPVYMSLEDKVFIANNKKLNLKGCLVIGSGWGEVSSERAYILLSKISCITKDGKLIEKPIKGWVMDDDGKTGLRGRLVTKQGAYLARSLVAGFLSGISKILSASSMTVQVSPIGTTQTVNPNDAFKVGMYSGMGSAAERLAKFYEKMAEQIFPVIEVNGGRRVVIAFKGGNDISKDKKSLETNPLKGGK